MTGMGGAAIAASRLLKALVRKGLDCRMLVKERTTDDTFVVAPRSRAIRALNQLRPLVDDIPLRLYRRRGGGKFSVNWVPSQISKQIESFGPDLVHLHWICNGFISLSDLSRIKRPIVWTLHDMWPFTGGCHYSGSCDRYKEACGRCPQLASDCDYDISKFTWKRKHRKLVSSDLVIVSPSKWLAQCATESSLFGSQRIEIIPNGVDTEKFKPIDKQLARHALGLPIAEHIVLFGAVGPFEDKRKGFESFIVAMKDLVANDRKSRITLAVFGASDTSINAGLGRKLRFLGRMNDEVTLALAYSAADVFVATSIQENLPNTILESLSCGTPCAAYNVGGIPDLIDHMKNGYLTRPLDTRDLVQGINWILGSAQRKGRLASEARRKAKSEFAIGHVGDKYIALYNELSKRSVR